MCKKQTAVSHRCAESEIVSLDAGLCIEGLPAPQFGVCVLAQVSAFIIKGSLQLLNSTHLRDRDKMLLRAILCGGVWNGFLLGKARKEDVPCRFLREERW